MCPRPLGPRLKVAFIPTECSGVTFYRMWQPAENLRQLGIDVAFLWYQHDQPLRHMWQADITTPEYGPRIQTDITRAFEWADVVVISALHSPYSFDFIRYMKLEHPNVKLISEFDDIMFAIPPTNIAYDSFSPGSPMIKVTMDQLSISDALVVSTPGLKEQLSYYHPKIYVVENAISTKMWKQIDVKQRALANFIWMGGASHDQDLRLIETPVHEVAKFHYKFRLKLIHGAPEFFKHKPDCPNLTQIYDKGRECPLCQGYYYVDWTHEFHAIDKYPGSIPKYRPAVGLAPLVDNAFNRAKSNLRWLEYSAMGLPTIASPVGHFKETLTHEKDVFFASNPEEWIYWMKRLTNEPGLRENVGYRAFRHVQVHWNPQKLALKYIDVLREVTHAEFYTGKPGHSYRPTNWRPRKSRVDGRASSVAA